MAARQHPHCGAVGSITNRFSPASSPMKSLPSFQPPLMIEPSTGENPIIVSVTRLGMAEADRSVSALSVTLTAPPAADADSIVSAVGADANTDADTCADASTFADADTDAKADTGADTCADANTDADTCADPDPDADTCADADNRSERCLTDSKVKSRYYRPKTNMYCFLY